MDDCIKKMWYIQWNIFQPPKRRNSCYMPKEKLDFQLLTTWINLEDIILREIRWSQNKYCMIPVK